MPTIPPQEHGTYREWLFLEPDGRLATSERAELERHLAGCADCRVERRAIAKLNQALVSSRIEVDTDLERRVLENLPAAGWEASHPKAWKWAAAVLVLVVGAAFVAGRGAGVEPGAPVAGTLAAVLDLFAATAIAGAGLLGASWQGIGLALGEVFGGSRITLGVFAVFVLGIDVLFVRLLLKAPGKQLATRASSRSHRR